MAVGSKDPIPSMGDTGDCVWELVPGLGFCHVRGLPEPALPGIKMSGNARSVGMMGSEDRAKCLRRL